MNDWMCDGCGGEHECNCDDCYCNECEYCSSCCTCESDDDFRRREGIQMRTFYTAGRNYYRLKGEAKPRLYFGIENEMEVLEGTDNISDANRYATDKIQHDPFYCTTSDGSLTEGGVEVKTRPFTFDWMRKYESKFDKLFEYAEHFEADNDSKCGMHINMARNWFTHLEEYKMNKLFESTLVENLSNRVDGYTSYCCKRGYKAGMFFNKDTKRKGYGDKYAPMSTNENTRIEVRLFQGTTKKDVLLRNVQLCHSIGTFAKQCSIVDGTNELLSFIRKNANMYKQLHNCIEQKGLYV